jgi:hypothetical protein
LSSLRRCSNGFRHVHPSWLIQRKILPRKKSSTKIITDA